MVPVQGGGESGPSGRKSTVNPVCTFIDEASGDLVVMDLVGRPTHILWLKPSNAHQTLGVHSCSRW